MIIQLYLKIICYNKIVPSFRCWDETVAMSKSLNSCFTGFWIFGYHFIGKSISFLTVSSLNSILMNSISILIFIDIYEPTLKVFLLFWVKYNLWNWDQRECFFKEFLTVSDLDPLKITENSWRKELPSKITFPPNGF